MSDYEFTAETLKEFQAEPLFPDKYQRSMAKISEAYSVFDDRIVVSYSGGKDSNVLADLAAQWCKIKQCPLNLAFCNTGLEYPEIQKHVPRYADYVKGKYGIDVNLAALRLHPCRSHACFLTRLSSARVPSIGTSLFLR